MLKGVTGIMSFVGFGIFCRAVIWDKRDGKFICPVTGWHMAIEYQIRESR